MTCILNTKPYHLTLIILIICVWVHTCVLLLLPEWEYLKLSHIENEWGRTISITLMKKERFKNFKYTINVTYFAHYTPNAENIQMTREVFQKTAIQPSNWLYSSEFGAHQIWVLILAPCLRFKWWGRGRRWEEWGSCPWYWNFIVY